MDSLTSELWTICNDASNGLDRKASDAIAQVIEEREVARARITALLAALEDVCDPLRVLQRDADATGRQLGEMANMIANNPHFIQSLARVALSIDAMRAND